MKKEYRCALEANFKNKVKEKLPQFTEIKPTSLLIGPGERVYQWTLSDSLFCFIILTPDPHGDDTFTIEVGWSKKGRFPQLSMKPSLERPSDTTSAFALDEYICRASEISTNKDKWWRIGEKNSASSTNMDDYMNFLTQSIKKVTKEEADLQVRDKVDEAINLIVNTAIPYLERFIASQKKD